MNTMGPNTVMSMCMCGHNEGAHKPAEAYYGESWLEGRMSSSFAMRDTGCTEYRCCGTTLREHMNLRGCLYKWKRIKNGDAEVPANGKESR